MATGGKNQEKEKVEDKQKEEDKTADDKKSEEEKDEKKDANTLTCEGNVVHSVQA